MQNLDHVNEKYRIIVLASLLHDVGKFAERAGDYIEGFKSSKVKYSHTYFSEQFIKDVFGDKYDIYVPGTNHTISSLTGAHHEPGSDPIVSIISEADCQAAGHERKADSSQEKTGLDKSTLPLKSLFEQITLSQETSGEKIRIGKEQPYDHYYMIQKLNMEGAIFPAHGKVHKEDIKKGYEESYKEFKNEFKDFISSIQKLPGEHISLKNVTIQNILQKYAWCMPETAEKGKSQDVSLYDHCRLTAMIAGALYIYHAYGETLDVDELKNRDEEKYILLGCDISGIQKFIYNIPSKGAYKALKGRSFFVQLLPLIIARRVLSSIGMNEIQVIYSTGGQFYALLPNIEEYKKTIRDEFNAINLELLDEFHGSLYVRNSYVTLTPEMFMKTGRNNEIKFLDRWDDLQEELVRSDRQKYAVSARNDYEKIFFPVDIYSPEMKKKKNNIDNVFKTIGEKLRGEFKKDKDNESPDDRVLVISRKPMKESIHSVLGYSIAITGSDHIPDIDDELFVYFLSGNHQLKSGDNSEFRNYINYPVGGLRGFSMEFEQVAKNARGSNMLGILRMDIDSLGNIFQFGLQEKYSVGRITTLSSMLIYFFSTGLSRMIDEEYKDLAVIVYSGGDDLFLLGQWDIIPEIAKKINNEFKTFAAHNPVFSLSAGVTMVPGKYPVYRSAEHAGSAEEAAKAYKRTMKDGQEVQKNSISFMGSVFDWDEFEELFGKVESIYRLKEEYHQNIKPLVNRINLIAGRYEQDMYERRRMDATISLEEIRRQIEAEKWRWSMVYSLSRFVERNSDMKNNIEEVMNYYVNDVSNKNKKGIENGAVLGNWLHNLNREIHTNSNNNRRDV